jgi:hypothetical protein
MSLEKWDGEVGTGFVWLRLEDQWRDFVNTVMDPWVPLNVDKFLSN